jgi:hypothetical protein
MRARSTSRKRFTTRPVTAINGNIKLNRAVWIPAKEMQRLKGWCTGPKNFLANLRIAVALAARIKSSFPGPLRNRFNYLKSVMPGEALTAVKKVTEQ